MKHVIFFLVCVAGLGIAAFFTVKIFHHGEITNLTYRGEKSIDGFSVAARMDRSRSGPTALFGKSSFVRAHPELKRVSDVNLILSSGEETSNGWILSSEDSDTYIARVYWNNRNWWESKRYHLQSNGIVLENTLYAIGEDAVHVVLCDGSATKGRNSVVSGSGPEPIFGKDAFQKAFPQLKEAVAISQLSTPPEEIQKGWVIKNGEPHTQIARIWWDKTLYWMSDWEDLEGVNMVSEDTVQNLEERKAEFFVCEKGNKEPANEERQEEPLLLFGEGAFTALYPNLLRVESREAPSFSQDALFKGWTFKREDPHTQVALIYWDNTSYWVSEWKDFPGSTFIRGEVIRETSDELTPQEVVGSGKEEIIFGNDSFFELFPDLGETDDISEINTSPDEFSRGWRVTNGNGSVSTSRIYWDKTLYWMSDWQDLSSTRFVSGEYMKFVQQEPVSFIPSGIMEEEADGEPPDFSRGEAIFGKDAFPLAYPRLERVERLEELGPSPDALSRAWVVEDDYHTVVSRVYWNDTHYWQSDWEKLTDVVYIEDGVLQQPQERGWDASLRDNWGIVASMILGEFFFAILVFFFLEALFVEFY